MKQVRMLLIGLVAGAALATVGTSVAQEKFEKVSAVIRPDYKFIIDGAEAPLKNPPLTYNGYSYLPVREAATLLGQDINFKDGTITFSKKEVKPVENQLDWISIRDLTNSIESVSIGEFQEFKNVLTLKNNDVTIRILNVFPSNDKEAEEFEIYKGGKILIKFENTIAQLDKKKLISLQLFD